jgi:hypothetical protein
VPDGDLDHGGGGRGDAVEEFAIMASIIAVMFLGCIALAVLCTVATQVSVTRMLGRIRREDPLVFESLGSPHVILNNTPRTNQRIYSFLKNREYENLRDQDLVRAAARTRKLYVLTFGLFGASLVLLLLEWATI